MSGFSGVGRMPSAEVAGNYLQHLIDSNPPGTTSPEISAAIGEAAQTYVDARQAEIDVQMIITNAQADVAMTK